METRSGGRPTWRDYQAQLKRKQHINLFPYRRWTVWAFGLLIACIFISRMFGGGACEEPVDDRGEEMGVRDAVSTLTDKQHVRRWLTADAVVNLTEKSFNVRVGEEDYRVDTSLNPSLQTRLMEKIRRSKTEQIGLVALDPDSGKVLAMVGTDEDRFSPNPCLDNSFPAASIFKIVTAAAAIEQAGFNLGTEFTFNGGKYTLYKSQLKSTVNRYTNTVSFRDAFAQSINPVFGKIGSHNLGRELLERYGTAFGFNREIDFEVTIAPSNLAVTDESYHLAEIACGFNRSTTLTPLHGALIAAAVSNNGRLPQPTMIEQVVDGKGLKIYQSETDVMEEAVSPKTVDLLSAMMMRTISAGTAKKTFRGASRDRVLSKLIVGGKTGSIDNKEHSRRMDWFVGFAREKNGMGKIAVAVVVGHGEYIGTRAAEFARYTFKNYFSEERMQHP